MAPLRSIWAIFCTAIGALKYASRHSSANTFLLISPYHGDSASHADLDSPHVVSHPGQGQLCGGFRYMSIWHNSTGSVTLRDLSGNFTASPEMENPKEYVGWLNCSGDKLGVGWQDSEWNLRSSGRGEARPHGVAWRRRHLRAVRLCVDQQPQRPTQSGP
ncbi:hypothetical protein BDV41DRAFT_581102 [Aspergillus transmontanensis]|uniref:Uncharacterized protein n=1 Tax=Aspergillus transmontanensis TaxID=1034304 RepID=A0A5N6VJN3_9EURO|nr:hypothetical protein BDV41DRAFT_581102 [Aspergillus transmontanensis]